MEPAIVLSRNRDTARVSFVLLLARLHRPRLGSLPAKEIASILKLPPLAVSILLILGVILLACEVVSKETSIPLGSLWYPVYGYDRDTGECQGGLGSAAWNDGGPPVLVTLHTRRLRSSL